MNTPDRPDSSRWRDDALCRQIGDGVEWFPAKGENVRPAKRVCGSCPVQAACLRFAMDNRIDDGVFGGLSGRERINLRREIGRATQDRAAA
jgi:WhiB family redox-sensing transcriptional regulator